MRQALIGKHHLVVKMGRGGYDLTDPKKARCSIAGEVLMMNRDKKKKNRQVRLQNLPGNHVKSDMRQDAATVKTSEDAKENLIRNKSTGIMVYHYILCIRRYSTNFYIQATKKVLREVTTKLEPATHY